jgi:hypothetical protein
MARGVGLLSLLVLVAVVFLVMQLAIKLEQPCALSDRYEAYCSGGRSVQPYCNNGVVKDNITACGDDETCTYGLCLETACTMDTTVCVNDYSYITRHCIFNEYSSSTQTVCGQGMRCEEGRCVSGTPVLTNWGEFLQEIQGNNQVNDYLRCGGVFDCDNKIVKELADEIIAAYNVNSPREYVDAVSDYIHGYINYRLDGGDRQCGETTSQLINKKVNYGIVYGNCEDYSVMMVALLRAKGIPARQLGGCISHIEFYCKPFAIAPGDGLRYGGLNDNQPLAHAYLEVWGGVDAGWVLADPTMGSGLSKCVGYYTVDTQTGGAGSIEPICYLPTGTYDPEKCL